jgi:hypothetical protein
LEKKSLPRTSGRLGHRTSIHAIIFLWGYLKQRVNIPLPKTLEDLRSNLTGEIENIPAQMLTDTILNFRKRCELLIYAGGGHIE